MRSPGINRKQAFLGLIFLLAGTLEYLVNRPIGLTHLLYKYEPIHSILDRIPDLYGNLGMFAPAFFHPLAFSLMSMALFSSRKARITICSVWFIVNSLFELGQRYGTQLARIIPEWFEKVPVLDNLGRFFLHGRFDVCDLIAIGLGSMSALLIGELTIKKEVIHEKEYLSQEKFKSSFIMFD